MAYLVFVLAVLTRFIPHIPNFSPVFGALLFGGAHIPKRDSVWFPVAVLAASDYALTRYIYGMQMSWGQSFTWLGFAMIALIGCWLRNRASLAKWAAAAVAGPTAFFLISNFGVWLGWKMYPPTLEGLIACYVAAIPFYGNSLLSSVLYTAVLFGGYEFYQRKLGTQRISDSVA